MRLLVVFAGFLSAPRCFSVLREQPEYGLHLDTNAPSYYTETWTLHQGATLPGARRQVHNTGKNTQGNLNALLESRKNGQRFSPTHSRDPAAPLRSSALSFELY